MINNLKLGDLIDTIQSQTYSKSDNTMTFGTKLRKCREKKRLSQREVADLIGVSQSTYSNWEGDIRSFRVEFLAKLAKLFNVCISELLSEEMSIDNDSSHKSLDEAIATENAQELYNDLLKSKDEIIQLLKENKELKNRSTQLENK